MFIFGSYLFVFDSYRGLSVIFLLLIAICVLSVFFLLLEVSSVCWFSLLLNAIRLYPF